MTVKMRSNRLSEIAGWGFLPDGRDHYFAGNVPNQNISSAGGRIYVFQPSSSADSWPPPGFNEIKNAVTGPVVELKVGTAGPELWLLTKEEAVAKKLGVGIWLPVLDND